MLERIKWSLIGIPDHLGVIHVGGRVGAAEGPKAFRRMFSRLKGRDGVHESGHDFGDTSGIGGEIEENHRLAACFVQSGHEPTGLSVVIGGGHDHGYSHLLGISQALKAASGKREFKLGCINIDAHLDVRKPQPRITSGSPFYLTLEAEVVAPQRLVEFGIQPQCNGPELWEYVERQGVKVVPFEMLRHGKACGEFEKALKALSSKCDAVVVSLDIDSASSAFAPGVSAPQAEGFTSTDILEMMAVAGTDPKVISLGIFELNPWHDLDDRTARLCATAVYHFISSALKREV